MTEPEIIYENENFLAVNKPAGLLVHAARISGKRKQQDVAEPTLVDWLLKHRPQIKNVGDDPAMRPGIVHRLDKDTSGIMLVPKTQEYFEYLKSLFQKYQIRKTYYAVVRGVPKNKEGIIDAPIGISNGTLKRSIRSKKMAKDAVTEYKVLKSWKSASEASLPGETRSLLEIHPKTGRTHQIRVHLASIGHPILGDKLYGAKLKPEAKYGKSGHNPLSERLMLHAAALEFSDRDGSVMYLSTEVPFAKNG